MKSEYNIPWPEDEAGEWVYTDPRRPDRTYSIIHITFKQRLKEPEVMEPVTGVGIRCRKDGEPYKAGYATRNLPLDTDAIPRSVWAELAKSIDRDRVLDKARDAAWTIYLAGEHA